MKKFFFIITVSILLSSCSSESNPNLNYSLHSDMKANEAAKQGYVVVGPSGPANIDKMEKFYSDYQDKKSSSVTLARYTDEGDPIYVDLEYDGNQISYAYDNTWDAFGGQDKGVRETSCKQMGKRTGPRADRNGTEYYLTSCAEDIGYSNPDHKEYFLLFVES